MKERNSEETLGLPGEDRRAFELLEDARQQYERYRELQDIAGLVTPEEPPTPPVPNWHTPLTLVIRD